MSKYKHKQIMGTTPGSKKQYKLNDGYMENCNEMEGMSFTLEAPKGFGKRLKRLHEKFITKPGQDDSMNFHEFLTIVFVCGADCIEEGLPHMKEDG